MLPSGHSVRTLAVVHFEEARRDKSIPTRTVIGENQRAVERYLQAIELDPTFADAWNNLGILLAASGKRSEACVAFEGALVNQPGDPRARYNLADTLNELGRRADAAQHWQAYLRIDATSECAAYARARLRAI